MRPVARKLAESASKQPMFAKRLYLAPWRDSGEPGGKQGVGGAAEVYAKRARSLYRK